MTCSHSNDPNTCRACRKVRRDQIRRDDLRTQGRLGTCSDCGEYRVLRNGLCSRGCNSGKRTPEVVQRMLAQLHSALLDTVDAEWRASTPWERADVLAKRAQLHRQIASIERRERANRPTAGLPPIVRPT